jgi:hypothetical protein
MAARKPKVYIVDAQMYVTSNSKEGARRDLVEILDKPGRIVRATITIRKEAK